jgi:TolA-binding protein
MRWNGVRESRTNVQGRNWLRSVLVAGSFGASGLTGILGGSSLLGVASPGIVVAQEAKPAAKPESSPEATALYADAASFQNNGAFDLAVDEWTSFLKKFPKDPLAPKAQHYLGVCQLQLKQFDKAAATFTALMKDHPKFELLEDATFNLALSHYSQASATNAQSYATAAQSLAAHLQKFPKSKHADQALFFQGESLYNQGEKKEAIAAYESVVKNYPESKVRADAAYAWGVTLEELQQYPQAGAAYDLFLKSYADNGLANEVRMRKAETVLQAGQFADAEKQFAAVAKVEGFAQADHASLRRAFCLVRQDKYPRGGGGVRGSRRRSSLNRRRCTRPSCRRDAGTIASSSIPRPATWLDQSRRGPGAGGARGGALARSHCALRGRQAGRGVGGGGRRLAQRREE